MYLRTTKRKKKDGGAVAYFQLAHNERDPRTKKSVARIIHNFGRADQLDREVLQRLCCSIARVCGLEIGPSSPSAILGGPHQDLPQDLQLLETLELGGPFLVEALWERLGFGSVLRELAIKHKCKPTFERALLAITANRLNQPESKLGVWQRWLGKVYLPSCQGLFLDDMYFAMDLLTAHAAEVEKRVFFHTANLLNLEVDLIFYDTTTASFTIDEEDEDYQDVEGETLTGLRKRGHSKEGTWTTQIVIALAVTREGFPVRCWVLPGNTSDTTTVTKVKTDLKEWDLGRTMFVADAGMNSHANRSELAKAFGKYILAARLNGSTYRETLLAKKGRFTVINDHLQAKNVIMGDGERRRRFILCYNPKQAKRQRLHREDVVTKLEEELDKHKDKKAIANWAIKLLASRRYGPYVKITSKDEIALDRKAIKEAARNDGKWVLETNDDTITLEDAALGYKSLLVIERCFRSMKKTQIKMAPMHHRLVHRIEGHVRVCVLALLIQRVAEHQSKQSWFRIRHALEKMQVTKFQSQENLFFRRNEDCKGAESLLEKLEIPLPKRVLGVSKVAIAPKNT